MGAAHLTIDLDAVAANWHALNEYSSDAVETAAVVKADGYGLDAGRVGRALAHAGVESFFVAVAEEGHALRSAIGPEPDIYVFSGHMAGDTETLRSANLIPLLNAPDQATRHFTESPEHGFGLQLDSGMNRLGFEPQDFADIRDQLVSNHPVLVISHLACADEPEHQMNAQQLRTFHSMTDGLPVRRSLAATGGILLGSEYHFNMTRPGIGLFGGQPFSEAQPVIHLSAPVIQTRIVQPFETVGYGNVYTAKVETHVATISAGYADGLIRAMGPNVRAFAGDTPCKVIGRVSMDLVTVDITHLDTVPERLDILCEHQRVDDLAEAAGTIGYEILTSLGRRYGRSYRGGA